MAVSVLIVEDDRNIAELPVGGVGVGGSAVTACGWTGHSVLFHWKCLLLFF